MWRTHVVWEVIYTTAIKNTSTHTDAHRHAHRHTLCFHTHVHMWVSSQVAKSGEGLGQLAFVLSGLCGDRWGGAGACA